MELRTETELTQEIERLRAELARREREAAAEQAGADLFLTKPFSPLELRRLVDRLGGDVPA